ncbi:DNA alkylation repair protein [Streptococcus sp. NM]|nr:DNA alkylation repair protein [Streptococcus mitis]REK92933.1 DNA alkylation repair protein [Streptococcus sp. NM]
MLYYITKYSPVHIIFPILFENLFKPRQLYLQPQNCALSNLRLAS